MKQIHWKCFGISAVCYIMFAASSFQSLCTMSCYKLNIMTLLTHFQMFVSFNFLIHLYPGRLDYKPSSIYLVPNDSFCQRIYTNTLSIIIEHLEDALQ